MATQYDSQIKSLEEQEKKGMKALKSSNTAYAGGTPPSDSDVYKEIQIRGIQDKLTQARDEKVKEQWFSDEDPNSEGTSTGLFGKVLQGASMPIYGLVGAIEHATGLGTKSSLKDDINENMMKGHRTFGDVISRTGAPSSVAAPVGFALDVMFDPVNWMTAGTTALIPRMVTGLVKGGVKGAVKGGTSSLLSKAAMTGSVTSKIAPSVKGTKLFKNLATKSYESSKEFNKLINKDVIEAVSKNRGVGWGSDYRITLRDLVRSAADKLPGGKGLSLLEKFDYDSTDWIKQARIKEELEKIYGVGEKGREALKNLIKADDFEENFKIVQKAFLEKEINQPVSKTFLSYDGEAIIKEGEDVKKVFTQEKAREIMEKINKEVSDATEILNDTDDIFVSGDHVENALRIANEPYRGNITKEDIQKIIDVGAMDETGIKWWDDFKEKANKTEKIIKFKDKEITLSAGKALDGFNTLISIFKRGKVAGSPSAWTNAIVGNPVMAWMAGVNIMDPNFLSEVNNARRIVVGKSGVDEATKRFQTAEMLDYEMRQPGEFSRTTGISPSLLNSRGQMYQRITQVGKDMGLISSDADKDKVVKELLEVYQKERDNLISQIKEMKATTPGDYTLDKLKSVGVTRHDLSGSQAAEIFSDGSSMANKLFENIATKAKEPGNYAYKLLDGVFNKAMSGYERIDQVYKMGTISYLSNFGITENELNTISRSVKIGAEDILSEKNIEGIARYRLTPDKANEIANEIYLNYQAMPAAVKMLRQVPVLGSPFASFMYGMSLKTAETAFYNPSVYNKVNYGIQEFGGEKSPLERKALTSKYYNYLNDPAMFRLPFWEKYPLYMNLSGVLPYYSLNMFNPTERTYKDTLPGVVVEAIDRSPLMDDPVGQVMFDYLILPMILKDADVPIGAFGQPIYPKGATGVDKTLLATRSVADALVPGITGFAGLATPSKYANLLPGYKARQLSMAKEGKTGYGKTSNESAPSRTFRTLGSMMGVPVQSPLDLSYTETEFERGKGKK